MIDDADHETIWLQPWCANCAMHEDRTWCQDNVWEDGCESCGKMPVEYRRVLVGNLSRPGSDVAPADGKTP